MEAVKIADKAAEQEKLSTSGHQSLTTSACLSLTVSIFVAKGSLIWSHISIPLIRSTDYYYLLLLELLFNLSVFVDLFVVWHFDCQETLLKCSKVCCKLPLAVISTKDRCAFYIPTFTECH